MPLPPWRRRPSNSSLSCASRLPNRSLHPRSCLHTSTFRLATSLCVTFSLCYPFPFLSTPRWVSSRLEGRWILLCNLPLQSWEGMYLQISSEEQKSVSSTTPHTSHTTKLRATRWIALQGHMGRTRKNPREGQYQTHGRGSAEPTGPSTGCADARLGWGLRHPDHMKARLAVEKPADPCSGPMGGGTAADACSDRRGGRA